MSRMLKIKELQDELNISRATIYRLINEGVPHEVIGVKTRIFDPEVVKEFILSRQQGIKALTPGDVLSNDDICRIFKCSSQAGMRRSHATNTLVIVSNHADPNNVYEDSWDDDVLYYTGMGLGGSQDLNAAQNVTLYNSNTNGVVVYLFEVFKEGQYTYRGIVKLVGEPFEKDELDIKKNMRKVWKFPVKIISGDKAIDQKIIEENQRKKEKDAKKLSLDELKKKAELSEGKASSRSTKSTTYERNVFVAEYSKKRANGKCELCENDAPFKDDDGNPYLESHHIIWLSRGGEDTIHNTCAVCPNCHKRLHVLDRKEDVNKLLELLKNYK